MHQQLMRVGCSPPHHRHERYASAAFGGSQVATLRSAVKLEQEQQFLIAKKLQELTGSKNIKLKPTLDTSLIGGFVVEYGSSQIDLSVKGQLERVNEVGSWQATARSSAFSSGTRHGGTWSVSIPCMRPGLHTVQLQPSSCTCARWGIHSPV